MITFTALFDACVLYPAPLRDLLMQLSLAGLFRARWTDAIHDEWIENLLVRRPDLKRAKLERTRELMNQTNLDNLVTGYEDLIAGLALPDSKDRHVLAAAIRCGADVIVTFNEKDFPPACLDQFGIETQHPDEFLWHLIDLAPEKVCRSARKHRARLKNPPKSASEYLDSLARQGLPETVAELQRFRELI